MKRFLLILLLVFVLLGMLSAGTRTSALSPYTTWAIGPGGFPYRMQDAYTPLDEIDLQLSGPEDMFLAPNGFLYVADTGNQRILKLDQAFNVVGEFGKGNLQAPTGLFVDEAGTIYVADAGKNTIVILDDKGNLIKEFGRPSEPLFGTSRQFLPRKIAVDVRKNLYIISEGSVDGLVMMNANGNFIGYFGANSADMSIKMILQRLFLTKEQLDQFIKNEAASPSNVAIDAQSLVYTITSGTSGDRSLRKFNISGKNLYQEGVFGSTTFRAVNVSENGLLLAVDAEGTIYEYAQNGTLLFGFGVKDTGEQRLGMLSNPTAIQRVGDDLYVLDKDKNAIVTYRATDFAKTVHQGVQLYLQGFYQEARPYFKEVLAYNGLFIMAYQAIADAYFKEGDYANALHDYRLAEDRNGYSEAFWELRNAILQKNLASGLLILFGGWIVLSVFTRLERRQGWLEPLRRGIRATEKVRLLSDFTFMFSFIRHPADGFYYIKQNTRGSLLFAFIIYAWVLIVRLLSLYWTNFVFSPYANTWQIHVESEIATTVGLILLWNVANYLVSTISDGEGRLRHVIIGSAYSLFPFALFVLPITLISNLLTLNEVFLYTFSMQLVWLWVGLMLIIMVKEIHNYSGSETVRNILATVFTMAMFLLCGYILYVLFNQLFEFVLAIVQEVGLRG